MTEENIMQQHPTVWRGVGWGAKTADSSLYIRTEVCQARRLGRRCELCAAATGLPQSFQNRDGEKRASLCLTPGS